MKPLPLLLALSFATAFPAAAAEIENRDSKIQNPKLSLAAAANLVYALDELNAAFSQSAPDVTLTSATGASGNLVAQIKNGAPYDVFLSADLDFPQALIKDGQADAKSLTIFAIGRLVLWTTRPALPLADIAAPVRDPALRKLAVANLATAPYGRAAQQALEKLGAWTDAQPKIVTGENITQPARGMVRRQIC